MEMTDRRIKVRNAILLGGTCSMSYLAVYVAKNVLSAVSPQLIESGAFTTEAIGSLSASYLVTYAVGQLINGAIGDKIKAKFMIPLGLGFAGICCMLFSILSDVPAAASAVYTAMGFFLAMIYGPMVKVVAENTEPVHATNCALGYTVAAYVGTPLAGVLAVSLAWTGVFSVTGILLVIMGILCFAIFLLLEKKGIIRYGQFKKEKGTGSVSVLIKRGIIRFACFSAITGIVRTTVVFWLPTYMSQYLGFDAETSALLFTCSTVVLSSTAFVAVFVYTKLKRNMELTIRLAFTSSIIFFILVYFVKFPAGNIVCLLLAIMSSNCVANMMWNRYCPSLRDTGMVSGATGFLDFISYLAAGIASRLFADAVAAIGWGNLILVWLGLIVVGWLIAQPWQRLKKA